MEHLLKLSGLLSEGEENSVDLGDLERRLQESAASSQGPPSHVGKSSSESAHGTPASSTMQSNSGSPVVAKDEVEVEALSDQMCSLVTNNCGKTNFIGTFFDSRAISSDWLILILRARYRVVVGILYILAQRNTVGKRKDWRYQLPADDPGRYGGAPEENGQYRPVWRLVQPSWENPTASEGCRVTVDPR